MIPNRKIGRVSSCRKSSVVTTSCPLTSFSNLEGSLNFNKAIVMGSNSLNDLLCLAALVVAALDGNNNDSIMAAAVMLKQMFWQSDVLIVRRHLLAAT